MASEVFSARERGTKSFGARNAVRRGVGFLDFDSRGRANVSEERFMEYLGQTARSDDYTRERDDVVYYFNGGGSKLAEYHRRGRYGVIF